jgi:hypothetical protein
MYLGSNSAVFIINIKNSTKVIALLEAQFDKKLNWIMPSNSGEKILLSDGYTVE